MDRVKIDEFLFKKPSDQDILDGLNHKYLKYHNLLDAKKKSDEVLYKYIEDSDSESDNEVDNEVDNFDNEVDNFDNEVDNFDNENDEILIQKLADEIDNRNIDFHPNELLSSFYEILDDNIDKREESEIIKSYQKEILDFCRFHEIYDCSTDAFYSKTKNEFDEQMEILYEQMSLDEDLSHNEFLALEERYNEICQTKEKEIETYFDYEFNLEYLLYEFGVSRKNIYLECLT